ncbi:hypothetical protein PMIN01_11671 [Paraphaeosphaeria minitans]|uniref:Uncharacterized protein n=1 Tax=Paraphaeosphaeria minitans TaxID=565426 RepID=A0A9P6G804_9PLEO|nr:hypothetical protein PMIN01_11671 [Paraphaeosphaeria minitans]
MGHGTRTRDDFVRITVRAREWLFSGSWVGLNGAWGLRVRGSGLACAAPADDSRDRVLAGHKTHAEFGYVIGSGLGRDRNITVIGKGEHENGLVWLIEQHYHRERGA